MSKYLRIDTGARVGADSPDRGVWYATHPTCGYWTDDWSNLKQFAGHVPKPGDVMRGGVPCCPECGCPGFQTTWAEWMGDAERFEREGRDHGQSYPRYVKFLLAQKGKCGKKNPRPWMARYQEFVAQ